MKRTFAACIFSILLAERPTQTKMYFLQSITKTSPSFISDQDTSASWRTIGLRLPLIEYNAGWNSSVTCLKPDAAPPGKILQETRNYKNYPP